MLEQGEACSPPSSECVVEAKHLLWLAFMYESSDVPVGTGISLEMRKQNVEGLHEDVRDLLNSISSVDAMHASGHLPR